MRIYLFIAAVAGGVTYLLTPLIRHIAIEIGAVGEVRARDVHTVPTPRMGGLGMLIGFTVAMLFRLSHPFHRRPVQLQSHQAWVILAGAIMISLLGMADDLWDLDWMLKLAGQLLISVFVAWGGLQIISLPLGSLVTARRRACRWPSPRSLSSRPSTRSTSWTVLTASLRASSRSAASPSPSIRTSSQRSSPSYASMATLIDVAMVGTCVGFILHNWHPAKLFMGDSGSMLLGYLITCASIVMTGRLDPASIHASIYLPVFMPILLPMWRHPFPSAGRQGARWMTSKGLADVSEILIDQHKHPGKPLKASIMDTIHQPLFIPETLILTKLLAALPHARGA